jgi:hypothetical protein
MEAKCQGKVNLITEIWRKRPVNMLWSSSVFIPNKQNWPKWGLYWDDYGTKLQRWNVFIYTCGGPGGWGYRGTPIFIPMGTFMFMPIAMPYARMSIIFGATSPYNKDPHIRICSSPDTWKPGEEITVQKSFRYSCWEPLPDKGVGQEPLCWA